MDTFELVRLNLLSPIVLAFVLGIVATLVRSDLRFPDEMYTALSIYLLLAIVQAVGAPAEGFMRTLVAILEVPAIIVALLLARTQGGGRGEWGEVLGVLAASAFYIAAPAAVRIALPEANPSFYLTGALAITFRFNLTVGIPLYYALAGMIHR